MWNGEELTEFLLSEEEPAYEEQEPMDEIEEPIGEEEVFVVETPVLDILGDMYVCSNCGFPLTEIPAYNRFYCENCYLHY
jgi:protein-arginine kinase activator protein McsA